jgi:hypothetical protein
VDPGFLAAGLWKLLLWQSRGNFNRQFNSRHEWGGRQDSRRCVPLQDRQRGELGFFAGDENRLSKYRYGVEFEPVRHGDASDDWRSLGIREVARAECRREGSARAYAPLNPPAPFSGQDTIFDLELIQGG